MTAMRFGISRRIPLLGSLAVAMVVLTDGLESLLQTALHVKVSEQAVTLFLSMKTPAAKALFAFLGIVLAAVSVTVMPLLARAKRRVAVQMRSGALAAEAQQTSLCAYLSAILLGGLLLNATLGWWWADPIAALTMVPIIAREGVAGLRARSSCDECC